MADNLYNDNSPQLDDIFPLREENIEENESNQENYKQNSNNQSNNLSAVFNKILSGNLFEDENILIIILLLIISKNHKDKKLIFALCYLLL